MNAQVIKNHGVSVATLTAVATAIGGAMKDDQFGQVVLARMPTTLPTDFDANLAALAKANTDQSEARGDVSARVADLAKTLRVCRRRTRSVRDLAKRELVGQHPVLHSDFAVGDKLPQTVDAILARADITHAGCVKHAELLEGSGWPAASTTGLAAAITAARDARQALEVAKARQKGATAVVGTLANLLYDLCRKVQIVANDEYPAEDAQTNALVPEARRRFLLGVFPLRGVAPADEPGDPAPAPAGSGSTAPASTTAT